ncbi:CRTAC1 family protein [Alphaproteobacteria bacterium KMM 3653]|uniref:CRTAC1 family protein n=1 Tax=Harenicola maris TaxID=2841044 RepID=A0AAP2G2R1_9RHOB|nr:CRTAC1 family protein [Harenicola maris]
MRGLLLPFLLAPALAHADAPLFTEVTGDLPVEHIYSGPWEHFVGGGVAVFDCNGDSLPELFAAGGENPARLFINASRPGDTLRFTLGDAPQVTGVTGAYPLDINSDGILDLVVLRAGANQVWRGGADCTFTDATSLWGIDAGSAWTTAFSAIWEEGADWPTLAFGNYVDREDKNGPFGTCDVNHVLRPEGQGRYGLPITLSPSYCTLSMLFSDDDGDGRPSLRVSNDRHYHADKGHEQMWELPNLTERAFSEAWEKTVIFGMGIASRDLTGDGLPEVMLTSMGDQLMQVNSAAGYDWAPYEIGTFAQRPYVGDAGGVSTGWHAQFGDVDNDARPDLFIAKGNVDEMPEGAMEDPNNLLMQGEDGTFTEAGDTAGVGSPHRGRGAALADLNADGWLDLVVVNRRAPMQLYMNRGLPGRSWIGIDLHKMGTNRAAVGAKVEVRTASGAQMQEVTVGGGHAGGQALPLHFGLGQTVGAEVRVTLQGKTPGPWRYLRAGRVHRIAAQ